MSAILSAVKSGRYRQDALVRAKAFRVSALDALDGDDLWKAKTLEEEDQGLTALCAPASLELADSDQVMAIIYSNLGQTKNELAQWQKSQAILESSGLDSDDLAKCYAASALDMLWISKPDKAKVLMAAAARLMARPYTDPIQYGNFCSMEAIMDDWLGIGDSMAWRQKGFQQVMRAAPRAASTAAICESSGVYFYNKGHAHHDLKFLKESLRWLTHGESIFLHQWPLSSDAANVEGYLGRVNMDMGDNRSASRHLELARKICKYALDQQPDIYQRRFFDRQIYDQSMALVFAYLAQGRAEEAFQASNEYERSTAFWLRVKSYDPFSGASFQEKSEKSEKFGRLLSLMHGLALSKEGNTAPVVDDILEHFWDWDNLNTKVGMEHPYPKVPEGNYDVKQAMRALDNGTLLMQYVVDASGVELFTLSKFPKAFHAYRLRMNPSELYLLCSRFESEVSSQGDFLGDGYALYKVLVSPAINDIAHCQRILICPRSFLCQLPFNALVTTFQPGMPEVSTTIQEVADKVRGMKTHASARKKLVMDLSRVRYFGDEKPIHRADTIEVYDLIRNTHRSKPTIPFVGLGRPDYHGVLDDLKGTEQEVTDSAKLFNGMALLGKDASVASLCKYGPKAQILHLACHGEEVKEEPIASSLLLSGGQKGVDPISEYELPSKLNLNADLVVLSACESGLGAVMSANIPENFMRLLQYAGAKSVVGSLWSVNDASTSEFMKLFYEGLYAGQTEDVALQQAGIKLKKRFPHPYYWAPFILDGDYKLSKMK